MLYINLSVFDRENILCINEGLYSGIHSKRNNLLQKFNAVCWILRKNSKS